jgi:hypothetical protein
VPVLGGKNSASPNGGSRTTEKYDQTSVGAVSAMGVSQPSPILVPMRTTSDHWSGVQSIHANSAATQGATQGFKSMNRGTAASHIAQQRDDDHPSHEHDNNIDDGRYKPAQQPPRLSQFQSVSSTKRTSSSTHGNNNNQGFGSHSNTHNNNNYQGSNSPGNGLRMKNGTQTQNLAQSGNGGWKNSVSNAYDPGELDDRPLIITRSKRHPSLPRLEVTNSDGKVCVCLSVFLSVYLFVCVLIGL